MSTVNFPEELRPYIHEELWTAQPFTLKLLSRLATTHDRENCIVVQWGYETQNRLMYVKVGFLLFAYVFSFVSAMILDIRQWCIFITDTGITHKD